jgi:hypothetical protein
MSADDLIALALEHRVQADRSNCPEEQRELDRVADIYTVLATIDIPTVILQRLAS